MKKNSGFTLIELMIAMFILTFISIAIYQNTTQSFTLRDNIERDGDFYNSFRVALDVMGRDFSQIYTPQSAAFSKQITNKNRPTTLDSIQRQQDAANIQQPTEFWGETSNPFGLRQSRFQGDSKKVSFIINSHMRLYQDAKESDFAKITYLIETDKNGVKSLIKKEDPTVFDDGSKLKSDTETTYTLLTNVKDIEIRFLDREKDQWFNRWDTMGLEHRDKFPAIIEVSLEVYTNNVDKDGQKTSFKFAQRFKPELEI